MSKKGKGIFLNDKVASCFVGSYLKRCFNSAINADIIAVLVMDFCYIFDHSVDKKVILLLGGQHI